MTANTNVKVGDEANELRVLLAECVGISVSPTALLEAYDAQRHARHFDAGQILESARASTAAERRAFMAEEEKRPRLKARRDQTEASLSTRTKELTARLQPWIENRRTALFGKASPPFRSLDDAATWIEGEAVATPGSPSADLDALHQAFYKLFSRLVEAEPWCRHTFQRSYFLLPYWTADGSSRKVDVTRTQRRLYGVYQASERIADLTTLPAATVVAWLLIGILPGERVHLNNGRSVVMPGLKLIRWRHSSPDDAALRAGAGERVSFDLDVRDFTDRKLSAARQEVAKRLGLGTTRPLVARQLTAKQTKVARVVQQLGGAPSRKYELAFWKKTAKLLKSAADPITIAKLYYRAMAAAPLQHERSAQ